MAFPIPAHLPRRASPQDISSHILSKIDAATNKTLNAELATSWVLELDQTITSTKVRLHERIQQDLPEYQRQLAASRSVQERLQALTTDVDNLSDSVSNPETGLIPNLLGALTVHAELAQQATDSRVKHEALSHLLACKSLLRTLKAFVKEGELSEVVGLRGDTERLLEATPSHLDETRIMVDLKRKFRAAQARNDEQLSDAYSRSIVISCDKEATSCPELTIQSSVQVRQSNASIQLPSILASLSSNSLSDHLTTLRRDLTSHFVDHISKLPVEVTSSSKPSFPKFSLNPAPSDEHNVISRLENLSMFFDFLSTHLFSSLPASQMSSFTRSLCKPTTTSVLNNILLPFLPSSFELLPPFLELAQRAVVFEDTILVGLLGNDSNDRPLNTWVAAVSGHYERQRRMQILNHARNIIVASTDASDTFLVEIDVVPVATPSFVPVQDEELSPAQDDAWGFDDDADPKTEAVVDDAEDEATSPIKDDAWGFDDTDVNAGDDNVVDENGWGFDDDMPTEPEQELTAPAETKSVPPLLSDGDGEPDPSAVWGWNEDEDMSQTEESAWDDPWGDEPAAPPLESPIDSRPPVAPSVASPKVAGGLQKAANKGKKRHFNGDSVTPSPVFSSPQPDSSAATNTSLNGHSSKSPTQHQNTHARLPSATKRPSMLDMRPWPKETYVASGRSKLIIRLVEDILTEGKHLASSSLFHTPPSPESSTPLGTTLLLTAPAVLDLHRALYPVKSLDILHSPEVGMQYANDCAFLSEQVGRTKEGTPALVEERLNECARCLKVLSESWFQDVLSKQKQKLDTILKEGTRGFTYTGDQDRYDECESAMTQALQEVRRLASRLKGILTKTKYYTGMGLVVEAVLARILRDILALPDIPEIESHRLSELCHIFNAMEGLFVEDTTQPSFVVAYVPSWLKFSYLSELLEASMADITYLFEEGALVDFEVEELVRLVQALFADTPLRTTTIAKLMGGHPVPSH